MYLKKHPPLIKTALHIKYMGARAKVETPDPRTKSTFFFEISDTIFECVDLSRVDVVVVFGVCDVKKSWVLRVLRNVVSGFLVSESSSDSRNFCR